MAPRILSEKERSRIMTYRFPSYLDAGALREKIFEVWSTKEENMFTPKMAFFVLLFAFFNYGSTILLWGNYFFPEFVWKTPVYVMVSIIWLYLIIGELIWLNAVINKEDSVFEETALDISFGNKDFFWYLGKINIVVFLLYVLMDRQTALLLFYGLYVFIRFHLCFRIKCVVLSRIIQFDDEANPIVA